MKKQILPALFVLFLPALSHAQIVWGGSTGDWGVGSSWVGGSVPDVAGGATAVINSGAVTYTPSTDGGDFTVSNGGTFQLNGGSWSQASGAGAWVWVNNHGTFTVNGGTFNFNDAGQFNTDSTTAFNLYAGVMNFGSYHLVNDGVTTITGGTLNAGEYHPVGISTIMSGGIMNVALLSFDTGSGKALTFEGGQINLGSNDDGFYNPTGGYLDFTTGSTGLLHIDGISIGTADGLLASDIRYNGAFDSSVFSVTSSGGGVDISLIQTAPEPSVNALLAAGGLLLGWHLRRRRVA